MATELFEKMSRMNGRMAGLVDLTEKALQGACKFGPDEVRKLREVLTQMEPILAAAARVRQSEPEIAGQIKAHKSHLLTLQTMIERLRVALIVERGGLEEKRGRTAAVSQWCEAFQHTR